MLALEINSMKNFMNRLLSGDTFDAFLLEEAVIRTANSYTIDGHMNADFFPAEERGPGQLPYDFRPWSELKSLCYDLIKGKYTPLHFKFVLQLKPEIMLRLLADGSDGSLDDGSLRDDGGSRGGSGSLRDDDGSRGGSGGLRDDDGSRGGSGGFHAGKESAAREDFRQVKAFVLNIRYDGSKAVLTTGVSYHTFVMNREAELVWDNALCRYLNDKGIGYEKL